MDKKIEEMAKTMHDGCAIVKGTNQCRREDCLDCVAVTLHEAGYRKQEDVVREMQKRLNEYYSQSIYRPTQKHPTKHTMIEHLFYVIDQIAKEMIGETK